MVPSDPSSALHPPENYELEEKSVIIEIIPFYFVQKTFIPPSEYVADKWKKLTR